MSALPTGWELDYDGSRWFYTYKPTGQFQYHFPSAGDEFPDYVDAASPAPQLTPEERLESQQQVRRRTSHHGGPSDDPDRWKSRMSATALPVSDVWEPDGMAGGGGRGSRSATGGSDVFQPESFMFLGPGTYLDVSPLMEEEEEAARRAVAGSSPGTVSVGTATPNRRAGADMSPQEMPAVPRTTAATVAAQLSVPPPDETQAELPASEVHMLDSREMPQELPVEERYSPVGHMAEMATEMAGHSREKPRPVELGDHTVVAPIETAISEGFAELPEKTSSKITNKENGTGARIQSTDIERRMDTKSQQQQREDQELQQREKQQQQKETYDQDRSSRISRKSSNPSKPAYQAYQPSAATTEGLQQDAPSTRDSMPPSVRRNASFTYSIAKGARTPFSPSAVPAALSLRQKEPDSEKPQHEPVRHQSVQPSNGTPLNYAPSVLKPARELQSSHSLPVVPQLTTNTESRPSVVDSGLPGVNKVPSVLKPARGRAGSIPSKNSHAAVPSPTSIDRPRKSYEQALEGQKEPDIWADPKPPHERTYIPYNGQKIITAGGSEMETGKQLPSQPARNLPANRKSEPQSPVAGRTESTTSQLQAYELQSDVITAPVAQDQPPISTQGEGPSDTDHKQTKKRPRPFIVDASLPGIYGPTNIPPASPTRVSFHSTTGNSSHAVRRTAAVNASEMSPPKSRSSSISSVAVVQIPSPTQGARRKSSSVSVDQSADGAVTFTPSPESQTPPSTSQSVVSLTSPPLRPSGLRHSISGSLDVHETTAREPVNPRVSPSSNLAGGEESYFPPLSSPVSASTQKQSRLPASEPSCSSIRNISTQSISPGGTSQTLAKSHPLHESSGQPSEPSGSSPDPTPDPSPTSVGHVLTRIEEHDEPSQEQLIAPLVKRHSMSSSIQQSPRMRAQSPAASVVSSISTAGGVAATQAQRMPFQGQLPNTQDIALRQMPPHSQHTPGYRQSLDDAGKQPSLQPTFPGQLPGGPQLQQPPNALPPNNVPPTQQAGPSQQWYPQMQPIMAPGFLTSSGPPQSPSSPVVGKEKDKKWAKWFKSSKSQRNSQPPQSHFQYYTPAPGQVPPQYMQGPPPPGWASGMPPQPVFWQPGHPHPQQVFWQPVSGAPSRSHSNSLRRASTGGSAVIGESQQADSQVQLSSDSQKTQQPGIVSQTDSQVGPTPEYAHPGPGPMAPSSTQHSRASSTASLPAQPMTPPYSGTQNTKTVSPTLFTRKSTDLLNPTLKQPSQSPASGSAKSRKASKWFRRSAGDYSGDGWGDEDEWNRRR